MKKIKKYPKKYSKIDPTIQLFLALGLFAITVIASRGVDMAGWEITLFQSIYNLPDFLHPVFLIITQMGSIYMLGLLLILYLIKKHHHIVLRLLLTGTLAYLVTGVAKDLWGRARPNEILIDVVNLDYVVRGPGFPSGHTALATALALTLMHYLPKKYHWIVPAWIVGVGLSRMYLGIHAPLDILGGFAIGWASYALFRHVRLYDIKFGKKHPRKKSRPKT
ncbi:MAG TPA: phosphatase PAP2 family protein [Patescibacteria group bacterium]|nr:phosphatase PAP2 family protein [Patescibacteria group bacterium]